MVHKTIAADMVHNFAWYDTREEVLRKVRELEKQGIASYYGGKRAKSKFTYHDIKIAAIHNNCWSGSDSPWVVAW